MNPYSPLFSHPADLSIAWFSVAVLLVSVAALLYRRFASLPIRSEQMCSALASAFLALTVTITVVFVIGLVFLAWVKITSAFWFVWQLLYLMSVVCVFRVLPFFALGLMCWALIGRRRASFSLRSVQLTSACLTTVLIDAVLYFWMSDAFAKNAAA